MGVTQPAKAAPSPDLWIGFLQTIDSLNPYRGINDPSYFLYGLLYDYPYAFDGKGTFIPNIITSSTHDASGFNWTYTVRQDVYWSDGSLLTANDVAFTWYYDSQNLSSLWAYEPYFNQVVQCTSQTRPHCGAAVTGTNQVTVYFKIPFAAGEDLFGPIVQSKQWSSIPPACAGGTAGCPGGVPYNNQNPIGTGPFIADPNIYNEFLTALSPGGYIHVSRNPRYHPVGANVSGSDDIHIQNIFLRFFSDPNSLATALLSGSIQLAQFTPSTIGAAQGNNILIQSGLQAIQEWNEIGISQFCKSGVGSGCGKLNPERFDINVRRAMAMATNKDYIINQFYDGQGVRGDTLISPVTPQWWYDPVSGGDNLTYNIHAANQLLNDTGYTQWTGGSFGNGYRENPNAINVNFQPGCYQCMNPPNATLTIKAGTVMTFTLATRPQGDFPEEYATAQYLQQEYARIGIQLILLPESTEDQLSADVYAGAVEMYIWYWSADPDPNYMLSMESSWTLDDWNDNFWNNATYNHYYIKQLADFNVTQRIKDVQAAEKINYDMAPYIIYIYPHGEWAMRTDLWTNWGNWNADPYMQMNAFWGANPLFFNITCPSCAPIEQNLPPTSPQIQYPTYSSLFVNQTLNVSATSSDPETTDTLNFTWTWGDNSTTYCPASQVVANCSVSYSSSTGLWTTVGNHAFNATRNYTVAVTVSDGRTPVTTKNPIFVNVTTAPSVIGWLRGVIRDASTNAPILGELGPYVTTAPGGATSSAVLNTGVYNITLAPGTYTATAAAHLYNTSAPIQVTITAGRATVQDFSLDPTRGWITGTVTNSATGAAIKGAAIYVTLSTGQETSGSTDSSGKFNITVDPGTYTVNVTATGFVPQSKTGVLVTSGNATALTFAMVPANPPETLFTPLVIAAIVAVIVIVVAAVLVVYLTRRRKQKEEQEARIDLPPKNP